MITTLFVLAEMSDDFCTKPSGLKAWSGLMARIRPVRPNNPEAVLYNAKVSYRVKIYLENPNFQLCKSLYFAPKLYFYRIISFHPLK